MRLRGTVNVWIVPFGIGAALVAHEALRLLARLSIAAHTYSNHEHGALGPAFAVEIVLAAYLLVAAVRDALSGESRPIADGRFPRESSSRIVLSMAAIAAIACGTLFGMEFFESGSAAFGTGWIGGSLLPGAPVLAACIGAATALLAAVLLGRIAGFEHLVALCAAALALLSGLRVRSAERAKPSARVRTAFAPSAPAARHAGLRAPPRNAITPTAR